MMQLHITNHTKEIKTNAKQNIWSMFTFVKFLFPVIISLFAIRVTHSLMYVACVATETFVIFAICNSLAYKNKAVAWTVSVFLLFIIYAQTVVLLFTGTYLQLIMLTNINSIASLRGKTIIYGLATLVSLLILFLPIKYINCNIFKIGKGAKLTLAAAGLCVIFVSLNYSPTGNTILLINRAAERKMMENNIRKAVHGSGKNLEFETFYSETIGDGIKKPSNLGKRPNIVLIFTEGLSRHILEDSRNIMPNVSHYSNIGLTFDNYYDHTAATYRGIIGQLYSSHQFNNGDKNGLISLQSILKDNGYATIFVNSEPNNSDFTEYLNNFGYDTVTSGKITDRILTDGETYNTIFDCLVNNAGCKKPVFVTTYTYGTHVTFDSKEKKFADGKNRLLNKFHNCDYQFGQFMEKLKKSDFHANTLVIFTGDHATYVDDDYSMTFSSKRLDPFCDTIPLIFWYEGIKKSVYNVQGRNSLCLAPTLLDYLDIDSANYFLGSSLFDKPKNLMLETTFCVPGLSWFVSTKNNELRALTDSELNEYNRVLRKYLALTIKTSNPIP